MYGDLQFAAHRGSVISGLGLRLTEDFIQRWSDSEAVLFPQLAEGFPEFSSVLSSLGEPLLLRLKDMPYSSVAYVGYPCGSGTLVLRLGGGGTFFEPEDEVLIYSFVPQGLGPLFHYFETFEFVVSSSSEDGGRLPDARLPVHLPLALDLPRWASLRGTARRDCLDLIRRLGLKGPKVWVESGVNEALVIDAEGSGPLFRVCSVEGRLACETVNDARALVDVYLAKLLGELVLVGPPSFS